ncbi:MAG TPA: preprotein translocase subunit SecA [Acidobacteriota bacterium]|nr:preprotein translocase subunit SecA [Acidobacteriota bacterium]HQG92482.1 preprotein translocase subunit SecA [Acidobacteriota bacterium]
MDILSLIFGTRNDRELKRLRPVIAKVNDLEPRFKAMRDAEFATLTAAFRERLDRVEDDDARKVLLNEIMPEAFAAVREAAWRTLRMRHFDVQILGGAVLHEGRIAEMKTGEGKTLVATLPAYLNALAGRGVHIVTVNDYLARRDRDWMNPIYRLLGLTTGVIVHDLDDRERYEAYRFDITYGTNNEMGFDYLRDNMKFELEHCVQRPHWYAIVDEVDSILIDEARTPLIISGPSEESTDKYYRIDRIVPKLKRDVEYLVDEKAHTVTLTEDGILKAEKLLGVENLYDPVHMDLQHHINQALRAHNLYQRDVNYVVKDGQVVIVDEFTGRLMPGRRWSDGLHQAVEAKEGVKIERENQTLATITFQNYFRMYKKLAGMTGTASTEAEEFWKIYKLEVNEIPTNKEMIRNDNPDVIYRTQREKFNAIVDEIIELHEAGQPVLVGTVTIDKSEHISKMLTRKGVPHNVLNAKYHEKEAEIVAQAGRVGAVTIATNMAGRGTDILLGGNPEFMAREEFKKRKLDWREVPPDEYHAVVEQMRAQVAEAHERVKAAGGLHILGTERHEARRIDNQLRGRAGRQGDPGSSRFYLSLEDDLMRIYGGERISGFMKSMGMDEGVPIESRLVSRQIEKAQKQVEAHNFQIRKHLLEYDDVMNKQREAIYKMRRELLEGKEQRDYVIEVAGDILDGLVDTYAPADKRVDEWDTANLDVNLRSQFGLDLKTAGIDPGAFERREGFVDALRARVLAVFEDKEQQLGPEFMRRLERYIMLQVLDAQWKDHLLALDHLKEGIGLRGYGQKDPLVEYKRESFDLFNDLLNRIEEESVRLLWLVEARVADRQEEHMQQRRQTADQALSYSGAGEAAAAAPAKVKTVVKQAKVGRNDPCPCGSGKKYKFCCGKQ